MTSLSEIMQIRGVTAVSLKGGLYQFNGVLGMQRLDKFQFKQFGSMNSTGLETLLQEVGWVRGGSIEFKTLVSNGPEEPRVKWALSNPCAIDDIRRMAKLRTLQILAFPLIANILLNE